MPKGYWIAQVEVRDQAGYQKYTAALPEILRKYNCRYVTRGGKAEVVEGKSRSRIVVLEFPDYETAMACYRSPEYAELIAIRQASADADLIVVEGYDGPQP